MDEVQIPQCRELSCGRKVFIQKDFEMHEVSQFVALNKGTDEVVHMFHGLLVVLAPYFLTVESQELWLQTLHLAQELRHPGLEQELRLFENGAHIGRDQHECGPGHGTGGRAGQLSRMDRRSLTLAATRCSMWSAAHVLAEMCVCDAGTERRTTLLPQHTHAHMLAAHSDSDVMPRDDVNCTPDLR